MLLKNAFWTFCLLGSAAAATYCELPVPGQTSVAIATSSTPKANPTCVGCITSSGVLLATSVPTTLVTATQTVAARALTKAQPLVGPAENFNGVQWNFMDAVWRELSTEDIGIIPAETQIQNWKIPLTIGGKTVETPIGVTGVWFPFGEKSMNWRMVGMNGCAGVIIVGKKGFWAGHFWESAKPGNVNGGSSFNYRSGSGENDIKERPDDQFKTIAIDILNQATPLAQKTNRYTFVSLEDLTTAEYGDPFSRENGGGAIYIITKASGITKTGAAQSKQMYESKITMLKLALQKSVRPNTISIHTYLGDTTYWEEGKKPTPVVPSYLNGVTIVQYSPWAAGDAKNKLARARVWAELDSTAAIDRHWTPITGTQAKRDVALLSKL